MKDNRSTKTIAQLRRLYLATEEPVPPRVLRQLRKDSRLGVQKICRQIEQRRQARRRETRRLGKMLERERELWEKGLTRVAGIDEAGVGCIAGPVVAAAVVFPPGSSVSGLDDSKKLDAATRSALAEAIRDTTGQIGLGVATVAEIAEHNVYWASILAMKRAVFSLDPLPQFLLIDARPLEGIPIPRESVIHGDRLHCCIAAASIIAKTHRDALMVELDRLHPEYGFAIHKGYCTKQHEKAIVTHGCCSAHRQSYSYVRQLTNNDQQLSLF